MNTQEVEDILINLKLRMAEQINNGIKTKMKDQSFRNTLKKQGYLQVAIRNIQELNKYGIEIIE